jgi:hypothetical protein
MRMGILLVLVLGSGAMAAAAQAERGDPQRRLVAADQRAAQAMLLRKSDLAPAFRIDDDPSPAAADGDCKALDESDLVLTGDAESPTFTLQGAGSYAGVASAAQLYRSRRMADLSWRRGTSEAGVACMRKVFTRELAKSGLRVESLARPRFARLGERTFALRMVFYEVVRDVRARVYVDLVALGRGRAMSMLMFASAFAPVPKGQQVALARVLAGRMAALPPG